MWKNSAESSRPQTTIWHMHIACWIPHATNTLSEYVMLIVFHCNNGCRNTPQYYIICALPVLLAGYSHVLHELNHTEIYIWTLYFSAQSPYQMRHVSQWCKTLFNSLSKGTELKHWHLGFIRSHTSETADSVIPIHHSVQTYHPLISTSVHLLESILKGNLSHTR